MAHAQDHLHSFPVQQRLGSGLDLGACGHYQGGGSGGSGGSSRSGSKVVHSSL